MAGEIGKTNAMRMLDAAGISYGTKAYEVDEEDLSGAAVARKIGLAADEVFKTLVLRSASGEVVVACLPVSAELDRKALAAVAGCKSVEMAPLKDLLPLTGYLRGGCSPIGMKKPYPVFLDETALLHERIAVSAGIRGLQLTIAPEDLAAFVGARLCDIATFA
jgi:Cys-tRNA(Pro)/Cys-tRNA(Cys) deacylase